MRWMTTMAVACALLLLGACDEEPTASEAPAAEAAGETSAGGAEEPAGAAAAADGEETTTGFVEATVDGERKRFTYLPADDNKATTMLTLIRGQPAADGEEFLELKLLGFDVRKVELPMVFRGGIAEAARGNLAAARRMPALRYRSPAGDTFVHVFQDDALACQSLEDLVLKCTFAATAVSDDSGGQVEITDGRLEVKLTQNLQADAFLERTVGRAADEAVEAAQEAVDRSRGRAD